MGEMKTMHKRTHYVVNKKLQMSISTKAIILPLITTVIISAILLVFTVVTNDMITKSNKSINSITEDQGIIVQMFMSSPALQASNNPTIIKGEATYRKNIGQLKKIASDSSQITRFSYIVLCIVITLTVVQILAIFALFMYYTHKITGPIQVITGYLHDIREGRDPDIRPLRKDDLLQEFYNEFRETIAYLLKRRNGN